MLDIPISFEFGFACTEESDSNSDINEVRWM